MHDCLKYFLIRLSPSGQIDCLRNAGRIGDYRETVLYSTLMPCYLCSGAAVQFKIPKVVVGESRNFSGTLLVARFWS